jgi:hypothetical protein
MESFEACVGHISVIASLSSAHSQSKETVLENPNEYVLYGKMRQWIS